MFHVNCLISTWIQPDFSAFSRKNLDHPIVALQFFFETCQSGDSWMYPDPNVPVPLWEILI